MQPVRGRQDAPQAAEDDVGLGLGLGLGVAPATQHPDRGVERQGAENVDDRVEVFQERDATGDECAAHDQGSEDPEHEDALLGSGAGSAALKAAQLRIGLS